MKFHRVDSAKDKNFWSVRVGRGLSMILHKTSANGGEPYWDLRELFAKLPHARTPGDYVSLLPTTRPPPTASWRPGSPVAYHVAGDRPGNP